MEIATAGVAAGPRAPQPGVCAIAGGDEPARRRAERLLTAAGFCIERPGRGAEPAFVVALLLDATDAQRVAMLRTIGEAHPGAAVLTVMPAASSNASLRRALLAGATGIVLDDDLDLRLVPTARAMLAGQLTVPVALGRQIAPRPLSHREKEVLALVTLGRTNREIAGALFLAESTVKTHLSSAFRKLDARSRSEAVTRILDPESGYSTTIRDMAHATIVAAG